MNLPEAPPPENRCHGSFAKRRLCQTRSGGGGLFFTELSQRHGISANRCGGQGKSGQGEGPQEGGGTDCQTAARPRTSHRKTAPSRQPTPGRCPAGVRPPAPRRGPAPEEWVRPRCVWPCAPGPAPARSDPGRSRHRRPRHCTVPARWRCGAGTSPVRGRP